MARASQTLMEEPVKFALLTRDRADHLVARYSERREEERPTVATTLVSEAMRR